MFKKPNCPVIAIEEHYWDAELSKTYSGLEAGRPGPQMERLFDLGALRIKEMDDTGIDMQVISHGAPSAQKLPADGAAAIRMLWISSCRWSTTSFAAWPHDTSITNAPGRRFRRTISFTRRSCV